MFLADDPDSRTRDRVLLAVSEMGPVTARRIAAHLELTPAAVRRHLEGLVEAGHIEERASHTAARRGRGRPARAYVLTQEGHAPLAADYQHMASSALHFLAERAGEGAVSAFVDSQLAIAEQRYTQAVAGVPDRLEARTEALAGQLSADGFVASVRPMAAGPFRGLQLCQGHCPVQHLAEKFPQFCDSETELFSRVLGVHVQRLATLADGAHVCTTYVPLAAAATPPGSISPHEKEGSR